MNLLVILIISLRYLSSQASLAHTATSIRDNITKIVTNEHRKTYIQSTLCNEYKAYLELTEGKKLAILKKNRLYNFFFHINEGVCNANSKNLYDYYKKKPSRQILNEVDNILIKALQDEYAYSKGLIESAINGAYNFSEGRVNEFIIGILNSIVLSDTVLASNGKFNSSNPNYKGVKSKYIKLIIKKDFNIVNKLSIKNTNDWDLFNRKYFSFKNYIPRNYITINNYLKNNNSLEYTNLGQIINTARQSSSNYSQQQSNSSPISCLNMLDNPVRYYSSFNGSLTKMFENDIAGCNNTSPYQYAKNNRIYSFVYEINGGFIFEVKRKNHNIINRIIAEGYDEPLVFDSILGTYLKSDNLKSETLKVHHSLENINFVYDPSFIEIISAKDTCNTSVFGPLKQDNYINLNKYSSLFSTCEGDEKLDTIMKNFNDILNFSFNLEDDENCNKEGGILISSLDNCIKLYKEQEESLKDKKKEDSSEEKESESEEEITETNNLGSDQDIENKTKKELRKRKKNDVQTLELENLVKEINELRTKIEALNNKINSTNISPAEKRKAQKEIEMNQFKITDLTRRYKNLEKRKDTFVKKNNSWIH